MSTTEKTLVNSSRVTQAAKYDAYRSELLDALRARLGGAWMENQSLVVMRALDELLKAEGLLPRDAPDMANHVIENGSRRRGNGEGAA